MLAISGIARSQHGVFNRKQLVDAGISDRQIWYRVESGEWLTLERGVLRRDHRHLGKQLGLFSTDSRVGPGLILWHPKGAVIRTEIENFERELVQRHGYDLVYTPHISTEKLFEISGHLENFAESMFGAMDVDGVAYRPKPMNCPGHIAIFEAAPRSYRDLSHRFR